jgi:hypothetical protein
MDESTRQCERFAHRWPTGHAPDTGASSVGGAIRMCPEPIESRQTGRGRRMPRRLVGTARRKSNGTQARTTVAEHPFRERAAAFRGAAVRGWQEKGRVAAAGVQFRIIGPLFLTLFRQDFMSLCAGDKKRFRTLSEKLRYGLALESCFGIIIGAGRVPVAVSSRCGRASDSDHWYSVSRTRPIARAPDFPIK